MHIMYRPAFVLFDGYVHHFDADALAILVNAQIFVFCLKSQDSDSDQVNDNGGNAAAKANYCHEHDDWLEKTGHAVPFT
eukprot:7380623-Prymnesium_polylepis.2